MPASSSELKLGCKEPVGTVLHSVAPGPSKEALQPSSSSKDDAKLPGASTDDETKLVDIALRGKPLYQTITTRCIGHAGLMHATSVDVLSNTLPRSEGFVTCRKH